MGKEKNPDPADLVNTIQKMAYKRALVAATLVAVNASEYFTQDIEDLPDYAPPVQPESLKQEIQQEQDDLKERKVKAVDFLAKNGKGIVDGEHFLQRSYGAWTQEDLDALKAWAKKGFPEE